MKAISIWEPWATLIAIEAKGYETRSWEPPRELLGKRLAIHAGKGADGMRLLMTSPTFSTDVWHALKEAGVTRPDPFSPGCIVATAQLALWIPTDGIYGREVPPSEKRFGDWSPGRFAWRLIDVHRLAEPLPCRGQQGLFAVPPALCARIPR